MSAVEQGRAVVTTIRRIIGGLTQARGAAGRAADEKSEITSDVWNGTAVARLRYPLS